MLCQASRLQINSNQEVGIEYMNLISSYTQGQGTLVHALTRLTLEPCLKWSDRAEPRRVAMLSSREWGLKALWSRSSDWQYYHWGWPLLFSKHGVSWEWRHAHTASAAALDAHYCWRLFVNLRLDMVICWEWKSSIHRVPYLCGCWCQYREDLRGRESFCWVVKVEGCSIVGYFLHVCSAAQRAKLEEINWSISLLWLVVYPVCVQTGRAERRLQLIFQVQVASSWR